MTNSTGKQEKKGVRILMRGLQVAHKMLVYSSDYYLNCVICTQERTKT